MDLSILLAIELIFVLMPYHTGLRSLRRKSGLDQEEVAELLDLSQGRVSRYEKGEEQPTLQAALGLQVIFGPSPRKLFPRAYQMLEEAVMRRAAELDFRLSTNPRKDAPLKRKFLTDMIRRATSTPDA